MKPEWKYGGTRKKSELPITYAKFPPKSYSSSTLVSPKFHPSLTQVSPNFHLTLKYTLVPQVKFSLTKISPKFHPYSTQIPLKSYPRPTQVLPNFHSGPIQVSTIFLNLIMFIILITELLI